MKVPGTSDVLIRGGRVFDGCGTDVVRDVVIENGLIAAQGATDKKPDTVIAAEDALVLPGLVDLAVHFKAQYGRSTIDAETRAASASGVTTLCCLPDTGPMVDSLHMVNLIRDLAVGKSCRVLPIGAATMDLKGEILSDIDMLKEAGCVGVSNLLHPYSDIRLLRQVMKQSVPLDMLVFIHPQDAALAQNGCAHAGNVATRLGLPGIPAVAETTMLAQCLALVSAIRTRTHFCRLSCAESVKLIERAKNDGLPVTADVAIQQLLFTEEDLLTFDTNYHVLPPYRSCDDREALRDGVRKGVIDVICSDHYPRDMDKKQVPFPDSCAGISVVQVLLPQVLELVDADVLPLQRAIEAVSVAPAKLLSIETGLKEGAPADLCVAVRKPWKVSADRWLSTGGNHPFSGKLFDWCVKNTLRDGEVRYTL